MYLVTILVVFTSVLAAALTFQHLLLRQIELSIREIHIDLQQLRLSVVTQQDKSLGQQQQQQQTGRIEKKDETSQADPGNVPAG